MNDPCAKNFSIFSGAPTKPRNRGLRLVPVLVLALLVAWPATAASKKRRNPEELFNPFLGVEYSHWLVGPIVEMAAEEEIDAFLRLTDDTAAERFVAEFWQKRNAGTKVFTKTPEKIFQERLAEADKRYTEAAYAGWKTDRGTIFILYGEPEKITYDSPHEVGAPTLEVWRYSKDAETGLDGERPKRQYRFYKNPEADLTVFYSGQKRRLTPRERLRPGRSRF